jgi:hypothetical protein
MAQAGDIFVQPKLPEAATWFYFSALLAVALFFKFSRLLSVRNWDVLTLFLPAPALLLLTETHGTWIGYLWLMAVSLYFFIRCLTDLSLVSRPALSPNLNLGGLIWLGGALFLSLIYVAVTNPVDAGEAAVVSPVPVNKAEQQLEKVGEQVSGHPIADEAEGRTIRVWVGRTLAIVCHLAIVLGLVCIGYWHFQDLHAGVAAATFYLLLPYTYLLLPFTRLQVGQWHHIWPMVLLIWAIASYRRPAVAGLLLGLATATVYVPLFTLPVWISFYLRRGLGRFLGAFALSAGLCVAVVSVILWVNGELPRSLREIWIVTDWQPWKELEQGTLGFWTGVKWAPAYRLPVFIAYLAFACTLAVWPSPKNLAHLLALTAASLIGIQFWYADQGGIHLFWYLPLLMLLVFRPNLADRRPPIIQPETDWLHRLGRKLGRHAVKLLHLPHPPVQVG